MSVTIGCDPELFLFDNLKQRIVPAIGKVGGTKWKPMKLDGGMVQLDGTLVEFGIDPDGDITHVLNQIRDKLQKRFHGRYDLRCGSRVSYHPDDISPDDPHLDVGCSPQYTFKGESLTVVQAAQQRTPIDRVFAGGHIHIGFTSGQDITDPVLIQSCKMFLDAMGVLSRHSEVCGDLYRWLYQCDESSVIRVKPYGMEWRNPCSYWLADRTILPLFKEWFDLIFEGLCAGKTPNIIAESPAGQVLKSRILAKLAALKDIGSNLPAKYQGTLPLDY